MGKGLSGALVTIHPKSGEGYESQNNAIIGNTALYGATSGEAFVAGRAGQRFGVRNSGANSVVEGIGNHGCEYMTGGTVLILGSVGQNFAAGMTGGCAYVLDLDNTLGENLNTDHVDLVEILEKTDFEKIKALLERHLKYTGSAWAKDLLEGDEKYKNFYRKVRPRI